MLAQVSRNLIIPQILTVPIQSHENRNTLKRKANTKKYEICPNKLMQCKAKNCFNQCWKAVSCPFACSVQNLNFYIIAGLCNKIWWTKQIIKYYTSYCVLASPSYRIYHSSMYVCLKLFVKLGLSGVPLIEFVINKNWTHTFTLQISKIWTTSKCWFTPLKKHISTTLFFFL